MIHKRSFRDARGKYHYEDDVEERGGVWVLKGTDERVDASLEKMSKSKYNVVNPDDMCAQHGADAMRLYELFMGPIEDGTEWDTAGVAGTRRFLDRAWRLLSAPTDRPGENRELERALHAAIKKVTQSITDLRFNTAIAEMMIFVNEATKAPAIPRDWLETFVRILSPFAPHLAEEMWQRLGHTRTIAYAPWPAYDEAKLARDTMVLVVQVNGKVRGQIEVAPDASDATILTAARADRNVQSFLGGKPIKREIYVKGRLVNLVS
jgi:leucyl-tRNA synthetase